MVEAPSILLPYGRRRVGVAFIAVTLCAFFVSSVGFHRCASRLATASASAAQAVRGAAPCSAIRVGCKGCRPPREEEEYCEQGIGEPPHLAHRPGVEEPARLVRAHALQRPADLRLLLGPAARA